MEDTKQLEAEYEEFKGFLGSWIKAYILMGTIGAPITICLSVVIYFVSAFIARG